MQNDNMERDPREVEVEEDEALDSDEDDRVEYDDPLFLAAMAILEESDSESDNEDDVGSNWMAISDLERQWALEVKASVEDSESGLKPLTDMEYAQYALVTQGNLQEALVRVRGMQQFREFYQVDDSPDQGARIIEDYMRLQPLALLDLDLCPETGEGILVYDLSKHFPAVASMVSPAHKDPDHNWKIHVLFQYYVLRTVQPFLHSIRQGVVTLVEASDVGWDNMVFSHESQLHEEILKFYPWTAQSTRVYNTNYVIAVFISMMKSFMAKEKYQAIKMGCTVDWPNTNSSLTRYTLRDLYQQSNTDQAARNLRKRARHLLVLRDLNEESFELKVN